MRRIASVFSLSLACAACTGSLLETDLPVPTRYVLAAAPAAQSTATATQANLSIGVPAFAPGLDTERIAVLQGRQLDFYRAARWGGKASELVQALVVDSLEAQKLFRSVTTEQARVASDYVLDIAVQDFQSEYAGSGRAPTVHVTITGRLIRIVDRQLVGTFVGESTQAASDDRLSAVVASFEAAAQKVAVDLAQKTATAIAGDEQNLRSARGDNDQNASSSR
jgi:cholesterol transport system auxiliary component